MREQNMKLKIRCLGVCMLLLLMGCSGQKEEKKSATVTVHTIGDSTMADYVENTTRTRGWGEMLQTFFSSDVQVINYARGGRSSRSFCEEGRWDKVKENLLPGDYVFIQFAHNDEKEGGKDGADGRGTAPWTTYKSYLEKYVDETRELGANPILVTPIVRRYFMENGTISPKGCHDLGVSPDDSTLNYVRVMKHVAQVKQVPLLDMTALTKDFVERLGAEKTIKCIYVPTDGTHTQATGAACYAQLVARELQHLGILSDYVLPEIPLVLNPASLDFRTIYVGDEAVLCFDLTGLNLQPFNGVLTLKAPEGMTLSDTPEGVCQPELSYPYADGKLWNRCFYLHFKPIQAGSVADAVTISYGKVEQQLPVVADCRDIAKQIPFHKELTEMGMKGLKTTPQGVTLENEDWTAEIDEDAKRYVEFIISGGDKTLMIRNFSFTLEGAVCYRVSYAYGKDFYPRTDMGERLRADETTAGQKFPMNVTLNPGERLHVRLFPWSTRASKDLCFRVKDVKYEGLEIE